MLLRLDRIFSTPGAFLPIEETFSPEWEELAPFSLTEPVQLSGRVENKAGVVTVKFQLSSTLSALCDRCLEPVSIPVSLQAVRILTRSDSETAEEEGYLAVPNGCLNTQELARCEIILNLPSRVLCQENCRGLCPVCGVNRNQTVCGCLTEEETDNSR